MPPTPTLVQITGQNHDVVVDLIYAGANNFTGQVIYAHPLCFLHPQAEAGLCRAIAAARAAGFRLKILDAFRPQEAQEALWAAAPNPDYIADPKKGSNHTRGVAIDLTLIGPDGQVRDMGTPVDTMTAASHHFHEAHPVAVQLNRMRLLAFMLEAGFVHHPREWWHYQLPDAHTFPLIDSHDFMTCLHQGA
ncbi:MAG: peptidase vanX D-ala-D-ala dipeptidase [Polaromonas sp.]|jgi:D-alanyl-D-alanine dipeptidase|nr:peptidase vanX D-ala-D-ala dipeptidase [Polaromonas sp.]